MVSLLVNRANIFFAATIFFIIVASSLVSAGENRTGEIYVYTSLFSSPNSTDPLENATFTILGPENRFVGNGSNWYKSDTLAGTYTIIYEPIDGYITPVSQTKTLKEGDSIEFSSYYSTKKKSWRKN